jgi:hypothetical protein
MSTVAIARCAQALFLQPFSTSRYSLDTATTRTFKRVEPLTDWDEFRVPRSRPLVPRNCVSHEVAFAAGKEVRS